jgi:hypothetical protein
LGNPGTGKTTCAQLYGQVLHHLHFLSKEGIVETKASEFVVGHVGGSETKTKEILKLADGKVLSIDEAYGLDDEVYGKQVDILNIIIFAMYIFTLWLFKNKICIALRF